MSALDDHEELIDIDDENLQLSTGETLNIFAWHLNVESREKIGIVHRKRFKIRPEEFTKQSYAPTDHPR